MVRCSRTTRTAYNSPNVSTTNPPMVHCFSETAYRAITVCSQAAVTLTTAGCSNSLISSNMNPLLYSSTNVGLYVLDLEGQSLVAHLFADTGDLSFFDVVVGPAAESILAKVIVQPVDTSVSFGDDCCTTHALCDVDGEVNHGVATPFSLVVVLAHLALLF